MELVLKDVDKKDFLGGVDERKLEERKKGEGAVCNLTIYDPTSSSKEVADRIVLERLEELEKTKKQEEESETVERGKFNNVLTFTDIPATIKKAGFHRDGSPKVAIAGLFDGAVEFIVSDGQAKYCSDGLSVVLAEVKDDWKNLIIFFVGLACVLASVSISITAPLTTTLEDIGFYGMIVLFIVGIFIPLITLVFVAVPTSSKYGSYFTYIMLPDCVKVRTSSNFYTDVPPAPENILTEISGHGPFAILFEVTEGWRKVKSDPVILRIINIDGQQFFEPVVGYDMTPLEKSSLVEV